jgi:hypothetical protein
VEPAAGAGAWSTSTTPLENGDVGDIALFLASRRIELAPVGVPAPEAIPAAPGAATVPPPGTTVGLVDDRRPLRAHNAESLWASAARPAARASEPARLALAVARSNRAAPWLIHRLFAEPDGDWLG